MNDIINNNIENLIYEIRGKQVMLSSDVAKLYNVETKRINEVIKRNIQRFPKSFCFQLTDEEIDILSLRSQFATLNKNNNLRGQHYKYLPYVLTEQGIMMLSGLLKSDIAVKVNVLIIDAFVKMRHYLIDNKDIYKSLNNINIKLIEHDEKIEKIFNKFEPREILFLNGEMYDAYSKIIDIFKLAKEELIIIDSYADKSLLDMISKLKVNVILITRNSERLSNLDIEKYNTQYNNLKVIRNNTFHDRYFIIDKKEIYHCGSSINNAGNKTFSINKLEDDFVIKGLINKVRGIIN